MVILLKQHAPQAEQERVLALSLIHISEPTRH